MVDLHADGLGLTQLVCVRLADVEDGERLDAGLGIGDLGRKQRGET